MKALRKLNLTNASERQLYGLRYIGGYAILHQLASYKKILRVPKAKSTTNQFILSKKKFQKKLQKMYY